MTDKTNSSETLRFESDKGATRSFWIALVLVVAIVAWMGSGFFFPSERTDETPARGVLAPVAVAVTTSTAEPVTLFFRAEGQAVPDRDTILRTGTSGDVASIPVTKGEDVEQGQVILQLDPTQNEADARRAALELERARRDNDNAERLLENGIATADRVAQTRAILAAAQAQVTVVEQAGEDLTVQSPFAGRIETLELNEGEFAPAGSQVGRLVDITPLTVEIQIPQQSLTRIRVGQPASVRFITGEEREGLVAFVGTSAASETRTFLAEVEVENEDRSIPSGISAEVIIPTGEANAHLLPPSIVSLDTDGQMGIKTVSAENVVEFFPIEIVRAEIDGIWVTGLPETAEVIRVGQGYVAQGETVNPRELEIE